MPSEPSRELAALRQTTEQLLAHAVRRYEQVGDRYEVPYQSTRIIVHPLDWTRGRTLLRVLAPVVVDVKPAPDLFRRLAELNHTTIFGKFYLHEGTVFIEHSLLGESLDAAAFRATLASIAHHADHLGDVLAAEFGGRPWAGGA